MFRKTKELQGLVNSRTNALKEAESIIEQLRTTNKEMEKQAIVQYEEKKKLEKENSIKEELISRIVSLANANKYNNEKTVLNKIKELVTDYQSQN